MAQRRMFSLKIIDTDEFLEMPATTQNLYFHLCMRADDDGFVSNPKKIMKIINSAPDDIKVLTAKKFVIPFDTGICVIKHWKIHNLIRHDRYSKTEYQHEKNMLAINDNKYEIRTVIPEDTRKTPQVRLVKDRKGKDIKAKDIYNKNVSLSEKEFNTLKTKFGIDNVNKIIFKLSSYKLAHGRKYKSDYGAINQWVIEACKIKEIPGSQELSKDAAAAKLAEKLGITPQEAMNKIMSEKVV